MKNIFCYTILLLATALCACDKDDAPAGPTTLPVNYANIAGTWRLTEWNGEPMNDGRYYYMIIGRKPDEETGLRPLEIYQNIDSDKSRHLTSTYELETDEDSGTVISGVYDHSAGFWNNSYVITGLEADRMIWTVEDDPSDISVYIRCEAIPGDILNGTRAVY